MKKRMLNRLGNLVKRLENVPLSFHGFLVTLLCIIFLRNFLETFSDRDNYWTPVSFQAFFIHYPLFYLCVFVVLTIILHLLTREKIEKIAKIMLFFFPLILSAPILDLMLSNGTGYNMSYLFGDLSYLTRQFLTFSWGYAGRGATPGIQIELLAVFVLVGSYVFLKTGRMILTVVGMVVCYFAIFVLGAMPSLVVIICNLTGSALSPVEMFSGEVVLHHFYSFNQKIALVFYLVLLLELGYWFWSYDRRKFWALVKNLRGLRAVHYLGMLGFGMLLGYAGLPHTPALTSLFPLLIFFAAICSVLFAWWFAVGVNDLYDVEADRITNSSRPLVSGIINARESKELNLVFLMLALVAAYLVRYPFLVAILVTIVLSYVYSTPPFRIKRVPFLATFILASSSALICLAGFVLFSDNYSFNGFPLKILLAVLVAFTLAFTVKDLKDLPGDHITGTVTLPFLLGEKNGKIAVGILVVLAYVCVPVVLKSLVLAPVALLFGIPSYVLINRKQFRETPVFVLYLLFLSVAVYYIYHQMQSE